MKRLVVTGASGLLGSYVVSACAKEYDVAGLDMRMPAADHPHVYASILDLEGLVAAFSGVDCVAHIAAAANIGAGSPQRIMELNVLGTWNVLEAAHIAGVRRVLLCSTESVMGNTVWPDFYWAPQHLPVGEDHALRPADPYGLSKLMAEEAGRAYAHRGLEVLVLRPMFILFPSMFGEVRARHADPRGYRGPAAGNVFLKGDEAVAVDWANLTVDPVGVDGGCLAGSPLTWAGGEAIAAADAELLEAYLEGLHEAEWTGNRGDVRRAFLCLFGIYQLYYGLMPVYCGQLHPFPRDFIEARFKTHLESIPEVIGGVIQRFPATIADLKRLLA